jgi:hypothetical protein
MAAVIRIAITPAAYAAIAATLALGTVAVEPEPRLLLWIVKVGACTMTRGRLLGRPFYSSK